MRPSAAWSVLERLTMSCSLPSGARSTSSQRRSDASGRLSRASRITETRAMSTSPRRSAVDSDSIRPVWNGRGRVAVARIAAATSLVRGVAWRGGLPNIL